MTLISLVLVYMYTTPYPCTPVSSCRSTVGRCAKRLIMGTQQHSTYTRGPDVPTRLGRNAHFGCFFPSSSKAVSAHPQPTLLTPHLGSLCLRMFDTILSFSNETYASKPLIIDNQISHNIIWHRARGSGARRVARTSSLPHLPALMTPFPTTRTASSLLPSPRILQLNPFCQTSPIPMPSHLVIFPHLQYGLPPLPRASLPSCPPRVRLPAAILARPGPSATRLRPYISLRPH